LICTPRLRTLLRCGYGWLYVVTLLHIYGYVYLPGCWLVTVVVVGCYVYVVDCVYVAFVVRVVVVVTVTFYPVAGYVADVTLLRLIALVRCVYVVVTFAVCRYVYVALLFTFTFTLLLLNLIWLRCCTLLLLRCCCCCVYHPRSGCHGCCSLVAVTPQHTFTTRLRLLFTLVTPRLPPVGWLVILLRLVTDLRLLLRIYAFGLRCGCTRLRLDFTVALPFCSLLHLRYVVGYVLRCSRLLRTLHVYVYYVCWLRCWLRFAVVTRFGYFVDFGC